MSRSFEKRIGTYSLSVSNPSPRWFSLHEVRGGASKLIAFMELECARDLHYALGRLIQLADDDDKADKAT